MEWVETTGRTIEEAKDAALDQLGVDETDAEFVMVSEPRAGLFGRMRGEARVRARVRPTSPRPKRTRTRRSGEGREGGARRSGGSGRGGERSRPAAGVAVADASEGPDLAEGADTDTVAANGTAAPATKRRRSRSRGGGSRPGGPGSNGARTEGSDEDGEAATTPPSTRGKRSRPSGSTKEKVVGETMTLEEQGESAREFVAGLIDEIGLSADVSARVVDDETAEVVVEGQELGILVGPGGATLAALQELARTFVQKRTGGQSSRINVDVAGYRAKRTVALQKFAKQIADEVTEAGSERALEPMSAADRKVVHDTINDIGGLSTRSEGEEPRRYIVISPSRVADVAEDA